MKTPVPELHLALVFSCEFCEIFKNTYFTEDLSTTVSEKSKGKYKSVRVILINSQVFSLHFYKKTVITIFLSIFRKF